MALFRSNDFWDQIEEEKKKEAARLRALNSSSLLQNFGRFRGLLGPQFNMRLGPALRQAEGMQAGRPGATGNSAILSSFTSAQAWDTANALQDIRSELAGLAEGIAKPPSTIRAAAEGAAAGGMSGGAPGAIAGAIGGALRAQSASKASAKVKSRIGKAQQAASPEAFAGTLGEVLPESRGVALASGVGQERAQALEHAIAVSGLRGTGLGTLASIAAGGQVELAGLAQAMETAMAEVQRRVTKLVGRIGSTVPDDGIARALEGIATLTAKGAFNRRNEPGSSQRNPLIATEAPIGSFEQEFPRNTNFNLTG